MSQRQSVFSLKSVALTSKQDEFCYEDMTDAELHQVLENIILSNLFLRLENDVFERYLARKDPESLQTIAQLLETAKRMQKIAPQHQRTSPLISAAGSFVNAYDRDTISAGSIQSGSRYIMSSVLTEKALKGGTKISYTHRIEMVNTEIRELQEILINLERTSTKKKVYFRAQIEENEISISEICKAREEFEVNVVQKGVDSITGKIPAEKFIRFIEEWLKVTHTIMGRVKLKMTTVKSQIRKVRMQLEQRRTLGEALRAIDFEQLNIENQDCMRRIEEKNRYLLEMKRIAGRYSIALTKHKEKLGGLMSAANEVRDKIISKKQEIVKLRLEDAVMKVEIEKAEKQLKAMIALIDEFDVPDVIDFVKMRVELEKLRRIHKQLSRQRKIRQIMFKSNQ